MGTAGKIGAESGLIRAKPAWPQACYPWEAASIPSFVFTADGDLSLLLCLPGH